MQDHIDIAILVLTRFYKLNRGLKKTKWGTYIVVSSPGSQQASIIIATVFNNMINTKLVPVSITESEQYHFEGIINARCKVEPTVSSSLGDLLVAINQGSTTFGHIKKWHQLNELYDVEDLRGCINGKKEVLASVDALVKLIVQRRGN